MPAPAGCGRTISGRPDGAVYIENRPYWNFGCATQRNLAAMVDNPADLVQPRGEAPAYSAAPLGRDRQIPQGRKPLRHLCRLRARARSAMSENDQSTHIKSQSPKTRCVAAPSRRRRRAHRAGAARFGAGVLRDRGNRRRRAGRRRRPPARPRRTSRSRWAAPPPPSKPIAVRRRRTSSSSSPTTAPRTSSPGSISSPRSATPARAWS